MKKPVILALFAGLVIYFISGCESKEELGPDDHLLNSYLEINKFCSQRPDYFFSGHVFELEKCLKENEQLPGSSTGNSYQSYTGYAAMSEDPFGWFEMGIATYPAEEGDESIKISFPFSGLSSDGYEKFSLQKSKYPFYDGGNPSVAGLTVEYRKTLGLNEAGTTNDDVISYSSAYGSQEGSTIEVLEKTELYQQQEGSRTMKITMLINCKLYDLSGMYIGDIRNGIMRGKLKFYSE